MSPVATILVKRGQRSSHNVHAAHQFIRPPIRKYFVDHQRLHLKSLRLAAAGESKSARDVVNQQAVGLVLCFDQLDQLRAQLRVRHGLAALDDQVALARNRRCSQLAPPVPIRMREVRQRRARHLKILQHAVVDQNDFVRRNAFVVKLGSSRAIPAPPSSFWVGSSTMLRNPGRICSPTFFENVWPSVDVFLAVPSAAVAKHFVEKNRCGAPGQTAPAPQSDRSCEAFTSPSISLRNVALAACTSLSLGRIAWD